MRLFERLYEFFMFILVVITIFSLLSNHPYFDIVNWIVWFIFFVDFVIRLFLAKEKWKFLRQNPLLIIAVIPFDQFFQVARISRVIYLFRIKTIIKFHIQPLLERISISSKVKITLLLFSFLMIEALIIYILEPMIMSFREAILCVISYLVFFGRNFFVVENLVTHIIIVFNSIIGVLIHGFAVQWGLSKMESFYKKYKKNEKSSLPM